MFRFRVLFALTWTMATLTLFDAGAMAGELTPPPGPIAATDATLLNEQWTTLPYTITQPGLYRLTSNLTGVAGQPGIIVASSHVTIDLNGFALSGAGVGTHAIQPGNGGFQALTVMNGHIANWNRNGITMSVFMEDGVTGGIGRARIEGVIVTQCGHTGISATTNSLIKNCVVSECGIDGVSIGILGGVIEDCTIYNNASNGISTSEGVLVARCTIYNNGEVGISLSNSGQLVRDCVVRNNQAGGIVASSGATIVGCSVMNNSGFGISIVASCDIRNNSIRNNGNHGITSGANVINASNLIQENQIVLNSGYGINLTSNTGNYIYRNIVRRNSTGTIQAPSSDAPITSSAASAGPWHNIGS